MRALLGLATVVLGAMFIVTAASMPQIAVMREPVSSWTIAVGSIWGALVLIAGVIQIFDWFDS